MPRMRPADLTLLFAPAKLNLGLEVLGPRPDGKHEVVTILQAVDLADVITLTPTRRGSYTPLPGEKSSTDLVARALRLARRELGIELAAAVKLEKHIPIGAGLGGGSSDAGSLLGMIGDVVGLLPEEIEQAAASLGSDVPFFVQGGTALAAGSGTELDPIPRPPRDSWFVVVVPDLTIPDKTRRLYAALTPDDYSDGAATREQAERLRRGRLLDLTLLRSAFARPLREYEPVREAEAALRAAGARVVLPSGAGPALFAPFGKERAAVKAAQRLDGVVPQVFVCAPIEAGIQQAFLTPLPADEP
ncbi:MAG TPA: 4-(cytidine 5'-diphospho)-2-C-methyl-D-erythritol kinase [Thermomicrobiaceae bacterium]|nr:4-(cytidine 5'-diphospho)-2-C-methyl-D-erythritol kinase [Thermomicrobiaceae bacterium]